MGSLRTALRGLLSHSRRAFGTQAPSSKLYFEDYNDKTQPGAGAPILIAHGMLGSSSNWTSLAKAMHRKTGRRVVTYDAVNHGQSPHRLNSI